MTCVYCGKILNLKLWEIKQGTKTITRKSCDRHCANRARGINPVTTRYRQLKINGRKIAEHRFIMESYLGRKLLANEYVHHIDKNKTNNSILNLKLVNARQHGIEHTKHPVFKICNICGNEFVPHKTKRKTKQTCSKKCRYVLISKTYHKNRFQSKQDKHLNC